MKQKAVALTKDIRENTALFAVRVVLIAILMALATQLYFVYLDFSGKEAVATDLNMEFLRNFDGRFENKESVTVPVIDNSINIRRVTNEVKIGKLAGNRNLEFGLKNVLEEYLQDKGYDMSADSKLQLDVSVVYLDVVNTKTNISILRKTEDEVVIRLRGVLYNEGKKEKEVVVEESSSEISMATLIVDQGGKFNQTSLSNALKKSCDKLITKLIDKK